MLALFYILIAILIASTFWQLTKIFNYKNDIATEEDNDQQGKLMFAFMVGFYGLMIYCFWEYSRVLLPEAASEHGAEYDNLYLWSMLLILFVQAVMQFLIFFFAYKYRGIKGRKALFYSDSHKLETIWTVTPAIVLAGLIIYGLSVWIDITDISELENPIVIEVYAKQFQWEARYAGEDNELGRGNVRFIKGINTMGVDMTDVNAADDIPVRELHLPKGRPVLFKFRSQDVLHSAYMPHFRAQMNCVPGMVTQFAFTPSMTTEEMRANEKTAAKVENINRIRAEKGEDAYEFDYLLLCNKICGASHYNMQMKIVVQEEAEFNSWLAEQKTMTQVLN
ncbi:cytochrome c oxidase subunit II [Urechidicola croceus]|uniref:cytochrome-c oxidase n=1 Tax=Urechidicola croceus TaxID=1850246 RepID=A0A1D8PAF3_9FLAO|nr:cytochrome c oxidase subunit II [Urechidicola croceus]AOW21491.1 cytochrome C oxidase subunit II [Urechidicola croceus]